MYALESPFRPGPISIPTLVATTTCWRLPLRFSQLPRMLSDSPPLLPGAHLEYTSAVSMKLKPAATKASSSRNEVGSSTVHPITFPLNTRGETSGPEFPSLRILMVASRNDYMPKLCLTGRRQKCKSHRPNLLDDGREPVVWFSNPADRGSRHEGSSRCVNRCFPHSWCFCG